MANHDSIKGIVQRQITKEQRNKFNENFDRIFNKDKQKKEGKKDGQQQQG
tara:strand:- start:193 stop:342 length:150 start_codon:yes stop_codon:yes gene_type:complete